jgi:hypothetical protein
MIRFQCPRCKKVLKAPDDSAGRKGSCSRCRKRLLVPAATDATPNPFEFDEPSTELNESPPSKIADVTFTELGSSLLRRFPLVTLLAWASPASLVIAFILSVLYTVAYHQLPDWEQDARRQHYAGLDPLPIHITILGVLAIVAMAGELLITVVAFVLGVMKNNKLAIVLSSVTFVLSWPILCLGWLF